MMAGGVRGRPGVGGSEVGRRPLAKLLSRREDLGKQSGDAASQSSSSGPMALGDTGQPAAAATQPLHSKSASLREMSPAAPCRIAYSGRKGSRTTVERPGPSCHRGTTDHLPMIKWVSALKQ